MTNLTNKIPNLQKEKGLRKNNIQRKKDKANKNEEDHRANFNSVTSQNKYKTFPKQINTVNHPHQLTLDANPRSKPDC